MKFLKVLIPAALIGLSLAAIAHEGENRSKKKAGPVRKDQNFFAIGLSNARQRKRGYQHLGACLSTNQQCADHIIYT